MSAKKDKEYAGSLNLPCIRGASEIIYRIFQKRKFLLKGHFTENIV